MGPGPGAERTGYGNILDAGPGAEWQVRGVGDVTGDGIDDIVLQNTTTSQVHYWAMGPPGPGAERTGYGDIQTPPGAEGHVRAVGDVTFR